MEHRQQNNHWSKYQVLPGLTGLYWHTVLRDIGRSLVFIFIPLYVYTLTNSLFWPFAFFAIYHLSVAIFAYPAGWIIHKIGLDKSIVIGTACRIISLFLLIAGVHNQWWLAASFLFWGVCVDFSWIPYHYNILLAHQKKHQFGQASSRIIFTQKLSVAVAPLVGSLVLYWLNFDSLYYVAIGLSFLSVLPLFFDRLEKQEMRLSLNQLWKDTISSRNQLKNAGFAGEGMELAVLNVLWPLFMFFYIGQVQKVGLINSASLTISLIVLLIVGKHLDRKNQSWLNSIFWCLSGLWIVRFFIRSFTGFILIDSFYYFLSTLAFLAFTASWYEWASQARRLEFLVRREIVVHLTAFISCLTIGIVTVRLNVWWLGFFVAAFGCILIKQAVAKKNSW
jgi:MFS family permease